MNGLYSWHNGPGTGAFGRPHGRRGESPVYAAQESGESEVILPPAEGPPPLIDEEDRRPPYPPGAPPFTGEDVEDAGEPERTRPTSD